MKTTLKTILASSLAIALTILVFSDTIKAQVNTPSDTQDKTVVEVVNSNEETTEFAQLLEESGFTQILEQQGSFTVLAPSNEAIENVEAELKENPQRLVQRHLYQGEVPADQVESDIGVTVKETDESASNGVVYTVDQVVTE